MAARARPVPCWLSLLPVLLAVLLLAGCTAGGPLAPAADTPTAEASRAGAPRAAALAVLAPPLLDADGRPLAAAEWLPDGPVAAIILALHGFGDYGQSTFAAAARAWAGRGILTIAIDQRGFGHNASRGRWPGADALIADAVAVSHQIRARFGCKPLTVVGHSMGGGVVLAAAARGLAGDSIVLAAPAIWGGAHFNPFFRAVAWGAASIAPDKRYSGQGFVEIQATDNLEVLRRMRADPLYLHRPSARELLGLVRVMDAATATAASVDRPALMLLGARDQIVPNAKAREVFAELAGPTEEILYGDGWHLLFRDLQAANVWHDVADWALRQPAPADACTGRARAATQARVGSAS